MANMEQRLLALEGRTWSMTFSGCWHWVCDYAPPLLLFLFTFAFLVCHALSCFLSFFMGPTCTYETDLWHRALAVARGITFTLLVLRLAEAGAIWWGARIFLVVFLFTLCCELQRRCLTIP